MSPSLCLDPYRKSPILRRISRSSQSRRLSSALTTSIPWFLHARPLRASESSGEGSDTTCRASEDWMALIDPSPIRSTSAHGHPALPGSPGLLASFRRTCAGSLGHRRQPVGAGALRRVGRVAASGDGLGGGSYGPQRNCEPGQEEDIGIKAFASMPANQSAYAN